MKSGLITFTLAGLILSCHRPTPEVSNQPLSEVDLAAKGRSLYQTHCTACHSPDPRQDGSLGPAISGSSMELIESRVMRAEYPAGYQPKRPTKIMQRLPQLKNELPALHAYLNSKDL